MSKKIFALVVFFSASVAMAAANTPTDEQRDLATDRDYSPAYLEKIDESRPHNDGAPDFSTNNGSFIPERAGNDPEFQKPKKGP